MCMQYGTHKFLVLIWHGNGAGISAFFLKAICNRSWELRQYVFCPSLPSPDQDKNQLF